jgi:polysaccharide biosynthesis transport protein
MRRKVADAEGKVEAFRAKSNLLIGNNNTTLSAQQLGDVNSQLATMRALKSDAEAKARLIREMLHSGKPIDSSDILNSELIRRLSEQRVTLRAQLAEQSATLLGNHPRIKELKAQIGDLDQQIRAEAETVVRSLENDAKIASARLDSQTSSLDQLKRQAASTNEEDVQLRALERDAKSQRDLLESYLAKYREATARDTVDSAPADARVISRGTVSNVPAYPKKLPTVLIATLAMMVLSSGMVLTRELLGGAVYSAPRRVAQPRVSEPAGIATDVRTPAARRELPSAVGVPISAIEDVAYSLRHGGEAGRRIAVLGAKSGIGTGLTAVTLALALAKTARVVLVDLGSDEAATKAMSSDPSAPGLAELARGEASFGNIITRDKLSPLHLIFSGRSPADSAEILESAGMGTTFDALARSYEHVVVVAGTVADAALDRIAQITPRALLVADALTNPATLAARGQMMVAGFAEVTVLVGARSSEVKSRAA